MLLILSIALLPLGLIAAFASRESAQVNRLRQEGVARALATSSAMAISDSLRPALYGLRQAIDDVAPDRINGILSQRQCALRLEGLMLAGHGARGYAIHNPYGRRVCATARYSRLPAYPAQDDIGFVVTLAEHQRLIRASIIGSGNGFIGVAEFEADQIARFAHLPAESRTGIALRQGSRNIRLSDLLTTSPLDEIISVSIPVAGGQLSLEMDMAANPISALEVILILLPILMWAAGALIGWLVVDRLLLLPLGQMQRAVATFRAGEGPLVIPRLRTPAQEITDLGHSFVLATQDLTRHEKELAEGLAKQKRLTREVHHRVKNNLQVISSLINLHARGTASIEASEAYASIQRRVDALALVHRHHYAEAENNPGISLRTLIGEIASNLRSSFALELQQSAIGLDLAPLSATQDIAVPVAFLTTEIIELIVCATLAADIRIELVSLSDRPDRALMSFRSKAFQAEFMDRNTLSYQRFQRISAGFARQLRTPLVHDMKTGTYSIEIAIMTHADSSD